MHDVAHIRNMIADRECEIAAMARTAKDCMYSRPDTECIIEMRREIDRLHFDLKKEQRSGGR